MKRRSAYSACPFSLFLPIAIGRPRSPRLRRIRASGYRDKHNPYKNRTAQTRAVLFLCFRNQSVNAENRFLHHQIVGRRQTILAVEASGSLQIHALQLIELENGLLDQQVTVAVSLPSPLIVAAATNPRYIFSAAPETARSRTGAGFRPAHPRTACCPWNP